MNKGIRALRLALVVLFILMMRAPTASSQAATVPVTVNIYRLIEISDPDSGKPFSVAGDYYAKVSINGGGFITSSEVSRRPLVGM